MWWEPRHDIANGGGGWVFSPRRPVQGPGSDRNRTQTGPRDPQAVPEQHGEAAPRRGPRVHLPSWTPRQAQQPATPWAGVGDTHASRSTARGGGRAPSSAPPVTSAMPRPLSLPWVCPVTAAAPRGLNPRSSRVHRVKAEFFCCSTTHTSGSATEGWSVSTGASVGQHGSGPRAQSRACGKRPWAPVQLLSQGTFKGHPWSRAIQCAHPLPVWQGSCHRQLHPGALPPGCRHRRRLLPVWPALLGPGRSHRHHQGSRGRCDGHVR